MGALQPGRTGPVESADKAEALSYFDRAARLSFEGFGWLSSEPVSPLMTVSQLASARTHELIEQDETAAAAQLVFANVRLARALSFTRGIGWDAPVVARAVDDLQMLLSGSRLGDASLGALATAFAEINRDDAQKQQLLAQRAFLLESVQREPSSWLFRPVWLHASNNRARTNAPADRPCVQTMAASS